jgi:hypothetical protein
VVSVCYTPWFTDREAEILPIARETCAAAGMPDADPRYWQRNFFLNECPLFKKMRISFTCESTSVPN